MDRETTVGRTTGVGSVGESSTCQGDYFDAGRRTSGRDATRRNQVRAITDDGGSHALGTGVVTPCRFRVGRVNRRHERVARRLIGRKRKQDTRKPRDACRPELVPADASALQSEASHPRSDLSYLKIPDLDTAGNELSDRSRMTGTLTDPPVPPYVRRRPVTCVLLRAPTRGHGGSR